MNVRVATLLLLLSAPAAASNLPLRINFQGRLTDPATGNPLNGSYSMTFKLYNDPSGSSVFSENQTVPVSNGIFSVQLGSTALLTPDLFQGASAYLGITVGADAEMAPRQRLVMAPYAFTAAQMIADSSARVTVGTSVSTFTAAGGLNLAGGLSGTTASLSGALSAASAALTGALNAQSAALTGNLVAASGGFTGAITASSGTFTATGAQYAVDAASGAIVRAGTLSVQGSGGIDASGTGIAASTATLLGSGASVYSLTTSSSVSIGADADVAGMVHFGLYYRNYNVTSATLRVACTTAGTVLIAGGCLETTTNQLRQSYPSAETTDATTAGTAVANLATVAYSWTCVYSGSNSGNRAFAVCGRVGN